MGIPFVDPAYILGNNQYALAITLIPYQTVKKKNQSIAQWRIPYVNTHNNEADILTKLLTSGDKRKGFVCRCMHNIFGQCFRLSGCGVLAWIKPSVFCIHIQHDCVCPTLFLVQNGSYKVIRYQKIDNTILTSSSLYDTTNYL